MFFDTPFWFEVIKAVAGVVTAVTAIVGVVIASRGLNRWRTEGMWKRRSELAEEVLAAFYEARDIINGARSPVSYSNEGATRQKFDNETEAESKMLNTYYAIAERLSNKAEFFAKLSAVRYRYMALFGTEASKPFDDIRGVYNEIMIAVSMLVRTYRDRQFAKEPKMYDKWEGKIWAAWDEDDEIPKKLDAAVKAIEDKCRPIITEATDRIG